MLAYGDESWSTKDWKDAFARRNYHLGMTLTAFRAEKFPDQKYSPGAFPVCSNEQIAGSYQYYNSWISGGLKQAGIVKCHYYYMDAFLKREESAELLAADWGTLTDFYFIKPEGADNYFLYLIVSTSKQPIYNELFQAYLASMKTAPIVEKRVVQNRLGALLENIITSWENEVSVLRLEKYYSDLDTLGIILTLKPLDKIVGERLKGVTQDRANRL